ncbi:type III secretion chaperone [Chlamydia trachomatis]|nr:type III secretion chaperone [Chlamydia trachomatis]
MEEAEKHLAKEFLCSGINLFLSGEYEQAEERLKESLELDSEAGLAYCYLGIIALETGRTAEALVWCKQGLEAEPGDSYLRYCYGVALDKADRLEEAIGHYQVYAELHPSSFRILTNSLNRKGNLQLRRLPSLTSLLRLFFLTDNCQLHRAKIVMIMESRGYCWDSIIWSIATC